MAGPPSPKRQRTGEKTDGEDEKEIAQVQEVIDRVAKVEEELEKENTKLAKEILAIESKYNTIKRPIFVKRAKLLKEIPNFWKQTFVNHMLIGNALDEDDTEILSHLQEMDVTHGDENGSYKIELTFKENPYFSNKSLWKEINFNEEGESTVKSSGIKWKKADKKEKKDDDEENASFIEWFASSDEDHDVADIIKEEIWKNPVQFYLNLDEDDDEEEEGEGEEGEDGEDDGDDDAEEEE
ncbi:TPA: hypothetical protein N0F65_004309 [Lagenidium giganteum]|uniref:Uncharacterized protein n=1 Tax=Lagenidium giganteum TaxID=4803 RepID=A0AAV2ZD26_9STRA|nr:TPA: hypothetical protein N0F65_004309 [Lagenidium giganteum]